MWTRDQHDPEGLLVLQPVIHRVVKHVSILREIRIKRQGYSRGGVDDADSNAIAATMDHPFWVQGGGWFTASGLRIGDVLRTDDGFVTVDSILNIFHPDEVAVYIISVSQASTDFVDSDDGTAIWVHNTDCPIGEAVRIRQAAVSKGELDALIRAGRSRFPNASKMGDDEILVRMMAGKLESTEALDVFHEAFTKAVHNMKRL